MSDIAGTARRRRNGAQRGAAALEYIMVSTFAAVMALAAMAFVGKVVKEELTKLGSRLGVDAEVGDLSPFGDGG